MKKILIVDDNVRLLEMTRKVLEATGEYEVMAEDNSRRAVADAKAFKPDLVILDVMMPGMDGGEVASALREQPATQNIPVLFQTSLANRGGKSADENGKRGIGRYLSKPIDLQELRSRIAELLGA